MNNFSLNDYLNDLKTIVNIDSGTHDAEGTNAVCSFMADKYRALGLIVKTSYAKEDDRHARPFLTIRNIDTEKIDILFICHMDTVFSKGEAAKRPFTVDENGQAHGPGCLDCKAGVMSTYYLIKSLVEEKKDRFSFCVAMNSDEEKGSKYSRTFIEDLAQHATYCFVMEPGRAEGEYVLQRKGGKNYIIHCHGISAHSGVDPEKGASAILELAKWVPELYKFFDIAEGTTINVGRFTGGADNGSVPDYAEFTISFRTLIPDRVDELDQRLRELATHPFDERCRIEIEVVSIRPAMYPHEKTMALLKELEQVGDELDYPIRTVVTGGGSDGNFVAHYGVATMDGCGPRGTFLHTDREYMDTTTVEKRLDVLKRLLERLF